MKVCLDLDGTLDSSEAIRELARSLKKRGDKIIVLTGCHNFPVTDADVAEKKAQLANLGVPYDKLKVFPNPPGQAKAAWCKKHDVALFIDNSLANIQLAPAGTTVLVPWRTLSA